MADQYSGMEQPEMMDAEDAAMEACDNCAMMHMGGTMAALPGRGFMTPEEAQRMANMASDMSMDPARRSH